MNHTGLRRRFEPAVFHVDYSDCPHNEQKRVSLYLKASLGKIIQCFEDKGLIRAKCQRVFKIAIPFQRPQNLFLLQLVNRALSVWAIVRRSCTSCASQRHFFLLFVADWNSWDRRKLLATVLKTPDKGFDLLIKFFTICIWYLRQIGSTAGTRKFLTSKGRPLGDL